jgi:hypothetical protein
MQTIRVIIRNSKDKMFGKSKNQEEKSPKTWWTKVTKWKWKIIGPICLTIIFYVLDYYTDVQVTVLYSCQLFSLVYPNSSFCNLFMAPPQNTSFTPQDDWFHLDLQDAES